MTPPPSTTRSCAPAWAVVGLLLAALLAPCAILANSWCLDDVPVVQRNETLLRGAAGVPRLIRRAPWPGGLEEQPWRPLALVSLALDHPGGVPPTTTATPRAAHLVNLALHALATWLLLGLLLRLAPGRPALAWGTALVFAVHPLAVSALTLATSRSALLGIVLGLLALRSALAWDRSRPALLPAAALGAFLALLSCEALAVLVPLALVLDALAQRASLTEVLRRRWPVHLALLLATLLWLALWPGPGRPAVHVPEPELAQRLALGAEALARGALKALVPVGYLPDRTAEAVGSSGFVLAGARLAATVLGGLLFVVALLAGTRAGGWGSLRATVLVGGLLCFAAALTLPHGAVLEDRWTYAALPALAVLGGLLVECLWRRRSALGVAGVALAAVLLALLGQRVARDYRDDDRVLAVLLAQPEGHGPALLKQAEALLKQADDDVAQSYLLPPRTAEFVELQAAAQRARARAAELYALARNTPATADDSRTWLGLARLELLGPTPATALEKLLRARAQDPLLHPAPGEEASAARRREDPRALKLTSRLEGTIGHAHQILGHTGLAAGAYREAARLEREAARRSGAPPDAMLLYRTAQALIGDSAFGEALPIMEELALSADDARVKGYAQEQLPRLKQDAVELLERLLVDARGYYESNNNRPAVESYEQALRVDPANVEARYWAAWLRGKHFGSYEVALAYVDEGLALLAARGQERGSAAAVQRLQKLREDLVRWRSEDEAESAAGR